jgi:hypothetical protein
MTDDLICIRTFATRFEAETAQSFLEGNRIRSIVSADDCAGLRPFLLVGDGGARLLVRDDDAERAAQFLDECIGPESDSATDEAATP